ncbi:MAG: phosphate ABC transporter permease subunit PstC [Clostridia bacterium]
MNSPKERIIKIFFSMNGIFVIFVLVAILVLLASRSIPFFQEIGLKAFFTDQFWNPTSYVSNTYGIRTMVVGTLIVTGLSLLFAIPVGVGCAAYLAEVAAPRTREVLKPFLEILAGIPSVVIGFFGLVVLNPIISRMFNLTHGLTALNGGILLAIMALPTIISISEDAIYAVPLEYKEASLALGASRWQTLVKVTLPAAKSGVIASTMLGMGRAIGETMTVLMVTGNVRAMPSSILDPVMTMTATIAIEMGEVPYNTTHYYALFALGLVLFLMTFLVNLTSDLILNKKKGGT